MTFSLILFYLFAFVLLASAMIVVTSRNMVHSVMFLILCFVNAAALFILLGAEFLAMLLIVVYVGAIAVLFLFVVMMLNVDIKQIGQKINRQLPILILVAIILLCEIVLITKFSSAKLFQTKTLYPTPNDITNTAAIGNLLYTDFILPFQMSGVILFVAMIGAIVLTLKEENLNLRRQKIFDQVSRNKTNSLEIVKVKSGEGIEI